MLVVCILEEWKPLRPLTAALFHPHTPSWGSLEADKALKIDTSVSIGGQFGPRILKKTGNCFSEIHFLPSILYQLSSFFSILLFFSLSF